MYQINLYRPELLPQPVPLSFKTVIRIQGVVLVVLLLVGFAESWQSHYFRNALTAAQNEQTQANAQLNDYRLRYPPISLDAALQEKVVAKERELRNRNLMLTLLQGDDDESSYGFSRFLAGFSRQHLSGLWLDEIQIDHGSELSLTGNVLDPDILPRYLERLASDAVFQGQFFRMFRLIEPEENKDNKTEISKAVFPGALHFELRASRHDSTSANE